MNYQKKPIFGINKNIMAAFTFVPTSKTIEKSVSDTTPVAIIEDLIASNMTITNNSGVDVLVYKNNGVSDGVGQTVKDGQFFETGFITNANQIKIARAAGSGAVTVKAEVEG